MSPGFAILLFVIIILVIVLSDSWITTLAVISIIVNFILLTRPSLIEFLTGDDVKKAEPTKPEPEKPIPVPVIPPSRQPVELYGPYYEQHQAYNRSYDFYDPVKPVVGYSCGERNYTIDSANALISQQRARDKRCMDGAVSKDKYFYQHHFGDELDEAENKEWWGRDQW